jgi:benzoylformate decarboxylase
MSHRCSFPEDHPQFAGFLQPARQHLTAALSGNDLVLVLGAPVFRYHVGTAHDGVALPPLVAVSEDEQLLAWAETGIGIRAQVGATIRQLCSLISAGHRTAPPARRRAAEPPASTPMSGGYVYATLAKILPTDAVVVEEAPSHRNDLHDHLPITRASGFLTMASGALGFGLPAAVGVALARPADRVVAVIGDGSAMYGIQGIWSAVRENARVTFLILDNGGYGTLLALGNAAGIEKFPGAELGGIDFCGLATALGCPARLIEAPEQLDPALRQAFGVDGPMLLQVRVDAAVAPIYGPGASAR